MHCWTRWTFPTLNIALFFFLISMWFIFWQIEHVLGMVCVTFWSPYTSEVFHPVWHKAGTRFSKCWTGFSKHYHVDGGLLGHAAILTCKGYQHLGGTYCLHLQGCFTKMLVHSYKSAQCHNLQDHHQHLCCRTSNFTSTFMSVLNTCQITKLSLNWYFLRLMGLMDQVWHWVRVWFSFVRLEHNR
jgi:hypothetical protein